MPSRDAAAKPTASRRSGRGGRHEPGSSDPARRLSPPAGASEGTSGRSASPVPVSDGPDVVRLRAALGASAKSLRSTSAATAAGLPPSSLDALGTVVRRGTIGLSELAAVEAVNPTMLSRIAARLEEGGLARRVPDPSDGRAVWLEPTEAGRRLVAEILAERAAALEAVLATMAPEERRALRTALPALESLAAALRRAAAARR